MTGPSAVEPAAELAARVLELVGPGAGAEAQVTTRSRALTRFARSFIHQNVVDTATRIRLRVVVDGSWAVAETDRTDADALSRAVQSALAAARLRKADPAFPGLAPAAPVAGGGRWDDATADATPDQRAAVVREFVDAAAGEETAGYVETVRTEAAYANTLGQSHTGRTTAVAADINVLADGVKGTDPIAPELPNLGKPVDASLRPNGAGQVKLDLGRGGAQGRLPIAPVEGIKRGAEDLHVLLRHRLL